MEWPEWQPIETAPLDGTDVLIVIPEAMADEPPWVTVGCYYNGTWQCPDDGHIYYGQPTHWMPKPPPPVIVR